MTEIAETDVVAEARERVRVADERLAGLEAEVVALDARYPSLKDELWHARNGLDAAARGRLEGEMAEMRARYQELTDHRRGDLVNRARAEVRDARAHLEDVLLPEPAVAEREVEAARRTLSTLRGEQERVPEAIREAVRAYDADRQIELTARLAELGTLIAAAEGVTADAELRHACAVERSLRPAAGEGSSVEHRRSKHRLSDLRRARAERLAEQEAQARRLTAPVVRSTWQGGAA